jgi:hypothetical protein
MVNHGTAFGIGQSLLPGVSPLDCTRGYTPGYHLCGPSGLDWSKAGNRDPKSVHPAGCTRNHGAILPIALTTDA